MKNSDEFLEFYNKIDLYLRMEGNYDSNTSFTYKIKNSSNKAAIRFKEDLISLGELRNAIVHNPKVGENAIAEPHDKTVDLIKKIYFEITDPKKVIPKFQFEVLGAEKEDYINDILVEMKNYSFSQFPVYNQEGEIIELINTNTISRWLSSQIEEKGTIIIENVKVKDLLSEIEFKKNYKFISRNTSIYDAYYYLSRK